MIAIHPDQLASLAIFASLAFLGVLVLVVQGVRERREHVRGLFRRDA